MMVGGNAEIDTTNSMSDVFETSAIEGVSQSTAYSYIVPKLTYTSVLLAEGKNEWHRCDARSGSSLVGARVFCELFQLISLNSNNESIQIGDLEHGASLDDPNNTKFVPKQLYKKGDHKSAVLSVTTNLNLLLSKFA